MSFTLTRPAPTDFALLAKCCASTVVRNGRGVDLYSTALNIAEREGSPQAVRQALKSAVAGAALSEPSWAGAVGNDAIIVAFVQSLRSSSVFARLLDDGIVPAPERTRMVAATTGFLFSERGEAAAIPVTRMQLVDAPLPPRRAAGIAIFSNEMVDNSAPGAARFIDHEMRRAMTPALDLALIQIASNGAPPISSTGTSVEATRQDLRAALDRVNVTGSTSLAWLAHPKTANALASMADANGNLAFPLVTPNGGELLGCEVLVTDQIDPNVVMLIDASSFVGGIASVTINIVKESTVEMQMAPTQNAGTSTGSAQVSLWQAGMIAVKSEAHFVLEKARSSAACVITGVAWGGAVTAS